MNSSQSASQLTTQQSGTLQPATTQSVTPVSLGLYFTLTSQRNSCTVPVCLLKTAVAPVISGRRRANANILFDEGSLYY